MLAREERATAVEWVARALEVAARVVTLMMGARVVATVVEAVV